MHGADGGWSKWLRRICGRFWRERPADARRVLARLQNDAARLDDVTRARIERIRETETAIRAHVRAPDVPGYARRALAEAVREMEPLVSRAAELARRRADLASLLEDVDLAALRREQTVLRVKRGRAGDDPSLEEQREQALRFKTEEIEACAAVARTLRRVDGQLESVEYAFAAFKARVLRLLAETRAGGEYFRDDAGPAAGLAPDIEILSRQMDALDGSVREVLALGGGGGRA